MLKGILLYYSLLQSESLSFPSTILDWCFVSDISGGRVYIQGVIECPWLRCGAGYRYMRSLLKLSISTWLWALLRMNKLHKQFQLSPVGNLGLESGTMSRARSWHLRQWWFKTSILPASAANKPRYPLAICCSVNSLRGFFSCLFPPCFSGFSLLKFT